MKTDEIRGEKALDLFYQVLNYADLKEMRQGKRLDSSGLLDRWHEAASRINQTGRWDPDSEYMRGGRGASAKKASLQAREPE